MTAAIDVYLSAARENSAAAAELADALTANGVNCFSGASDSPPAETLAALESGCALVFVLSSASNASPDVVRELERAAGRGIPIITYAIEDVSRSPSIAYFTETIPPIQAWAGEARERTIHNVVEATRRALSEPASSTTRTGLGRAHYAKATYRDAKGLQIGVAAALAISACLNAYVLYRDASFVVAPLLGRQGQSVATAADYLGSTTLASTFGNWSVIVGSILMLRRARLNLLSFFANVRTGGGEIVWRPLVPFANALWLPRMATDLRDSGDSDDARVKNWSLARYWGLAFLCAYSFTGLRDGLLNAVPQSVGLLVGLECGAGCVSHRHCVPDVCGSLAGARPCSRKATLQAHATSLVCSRRVRCPACHRRGFPNRSRRCLIAFASEDETIAGLVAKGLEDVSMSLLDNQSGDQWRNTFTTSPGGVRRDLGCRVPSESFVSVDHWSWFDARWPDRRPSFHSSWTRRRRGARLAITSALSTGSTAPPGLRRCSRNACERHSARIGVIPPGPVGQRWRSTAGCFSVCTALRLAKIDTVPQGVCVRRRRRWRSGKSPARRSLESSPSQLHSSPRIKSR